MWLYFLNHLETYERKGKLQKKSLNTDKFKERQFVLDKDQLFYYKNEKQSKSNISYFTKCDYRGQKLQSNNAGERADSNLELDWVQVTETLLRNWEREQEVCTEH